jgi:hypothetical protein
MDSLVAGFESEKQVSWKDTLIGLLVAIVASIVATVIAFYIVDAAGLIPDSVTIERMNGDNGAIGVGDVIGTVLFDWVIAGIVLLLLRAFTRRPLRIFLIIAVVALVASFALPAIQIDDIPAKMVVGLDILHVVAAVSGLGVLYRYFGSRA